MTNDSRSNRLFGETDSRTTLEAEVLRVVYSSPDHGWTVLRFLDPQGRKKFTAVGHLAGVQPGEILRMTGEWIEDRKFGRQFNVDSFLAIQPTTRLGITRFLGSGLMPGIGPVMAERLVDHFGAETLDVIENQPERLTEVAGIGHHRARGIRRAWERQSGAREALIFLQSYGIGLGQASRIFRQYGSRSIEVIRTDPYRLAEEVHGFGFRTADEIAMRVGIERDAPSRAAAGLLHVLANAEAQGHVFLPLRKLLTLAGQLLERSPDALQSALEDLGRQSRVTAEPDMLDPDAAVFRRRLHVAEVELAGRIRQLAARECAPVAVDWNQRLARFEAGQGIELSECQKQAVGRALAEPILIITGGPGTGKTTMVRAIVDLLGGKGDFEIELAAPTGRAAKRLSEATGLEARTIHRLLEFEPRSLSFQRHRQRPLETDLIIVDETSMLDCPLAWHLFEALPEDCRVILVGDVDQLPSVGPGRVLADLIESGRVPVVRLDEVFRQAASSLIVANAHRIRQGLMPRLETDPEVDFFFIERPEPDEILQTIEHLLMVRIPRRFGLDPKKDIQLLAPMRRGMVGVERLNLAVQELLSGSEPKLDVSGGRFRRGDRVMQIRNNYELDVFNGDIGHVLEVSADGESLLVDFYGRRLAYPVSDSDQLVLAYACSIHKSQGSEYPCVILPLHSQHYLMLQRNLLYTAVTRGRRLVIIVGEQKALAQAVRNARPQVRHTRLVERLRSDS